MQTTSSLVALRIRKVGWERFDMKNHPVQYEEATASTLNYMRNIWILVTARHLGRNLTGEEIIYWYFNWWYWLSLVKLFQKSPASYVVCGFPGLCYQYCNVNFRPSPFSKSSAKVSDNLLDRRLSLKWLHGIWLGTLQILYKKGCVFYI